MAAGVDPREVDSAALQASFDYSLHGIVQTDEAGAVRACNPAAASILGVPRRRLVGSDFASALSLDAAARERWQRHFGLVAEQGMAIVTVLHAQAGGNRILEFASIDLGGGRRLHLFDDVTEQRNLNASLKAAKRAADEASAAKSAFLATMSHEIRTPLNGIVGLERLLRLTPLTSQQAAYLDDLGRAARTLLALLGDVLDVSKIEAGRLELESRPFDADDFFETVATGCGSPGPGKPVRLVFALDPGLPRRWVGDPVRLAQAASNLVANALKFTLEGRVTLSASWAAGEAGEGRLRLAVSDTGIGMTPEQLARVFSPFVQADASVTRRFGGSGLGLAIVRGIAERMGGTLTASSVPGEGSEFVLDVPMKSEPGMASGGNGRATLSVRLRVRDDAFRGALEQLLEAEGVAVPGPVPAAPGDPAPEPRDGTVEIVEEADGSVTVSGPAGAFPLREPCTPLRLRRALDECRGVGGGASAAADDSPDSLESLRGAWGGNRALVVDDDAVGRRVMTGLLAFAGIAAETAEDGKAACGRLLDGDAPPVQVVFMDLHMPVVDGLAATRTLRASGFRQPIVALSAATSPAERAQCLAAGMDDWLPKPPKVAEIGAVLGRWLPPRPAEAAPAAIPRMAPGDGGEALPGIDVAAALERFLGNRAALHEALRAFVRTRGPQVADIAGLVERGERAPLADVAHGIAGGAAILGADELLALARALEAAARNTAGPIPDGLPQRLAAAFALVATGVGRT